MSIIKVSALYVQKNSIYKTLGVDCWDEVRDARLFPGGNPVIAHPPCRLWSKMAVFSTAPPEEKDLAILAIKQVRENGGVLEHPRSSKLWPEYLPFPGERDVFGGYSICVNQHWWGHRGEKKTLLYIVGCDERDLPGIPLSLDAVECIFTDFNLPRGEKRKPLKKKERSATPIKFAEFLIDIAKRCANDKA